MMIIISIVVSPGNLIAQSAQPILIFENLIPFHAALLLLDEPSPGLSLKAVQKSFEPIKIISAQFKTSMLIVEQNVKGVLEIADKVYAMRLGKVVLENIPTKN